MCSINTKFFSTELVTHCPGFMGHGNKKPTTIKAKIKEYKKYIPDIETQLTNIGTRVDDICHGVETFINVARMEGKEIDQKALITYLNETVKQSDRTIDNRPKRIKNSINTKQKLT
ncbi:MAG: hypothetical protein IPL42_01155 [Saprospiraceae bacterium]|nr:hypothetical protein [Saprospiraceae bacterium]